MFEEYLDIRDCACGKPHSLVTRDYIIETDAMLRLPELLDKLRLSARPLAVYDSNTLEAAHPKIATAMPKLDALILQEHDGRVVPDERQLDAVMSTAAEHGSSVLIGIGAGVICDLTRYAALKLDLPFIAVPTAASVDGFVSSSSAMTFGGAKVTLPTKAPVAVVADLEIISAAPLRLSASGVGDMLSKYISVADWQIGHLITGEYYCQCIADMELQAADSVVEHIEQIKMGDIEGMGKLMEGLLISGMAMQLSGITRPASSFEHHISHYLETLPAPSSAKDALHGEKVGVSTVFTAQHYASLAASLKRIYTDHLENKFSTGRIRDCFSDFPPEIVNVVIDENTPNVSENLDVKLLERNHGKVMDVCYQIPSYHIIIDTLDKIDGCASYTDIGLSEDEFHHIASRACYSRNRFTVPRVAVDYKLADPGKLEAYIRSPKKIIE